VAATFATLVVRELRQRHKTLPWCGADDCHMPDNIIIILKHSHLSFYCSINIIALFVFVTHCNFEKNAAEIMPVVLSALAVQFAYNTFVHVRVASPTRGSFLNSPRMS